MRQLVYFVAVSLDGRIAAPDGAFEAFATTGDHIDWIVREWPDTLPKVALDALGVQADNTRFDTVLMGWHTYAAGLAVTDSPYPHLDQWVFSRTRSSEDVPADVTLTDRDPVEVVHELKQQPGGDIWLCGGGVLAGRLVEQIDRLVLKVNPVVLGTGRPLLDGAGYDPHHLSLTASTRFDSGVVVTEYER